MFSQPPRIVKEPTVLAPPVEIRLDEATQDDERMMASPPVRGHDIRIQAPSPNRKRSSEVAEITDEAIDVTNRTAADERNMRSKTPPEKRLKVGNNLKVDTIDLT